MKPSVHSLDISNSLNLLGRDVCLFQNQTQEEEILNPLFCISNLID